MQIQNLDPSKKYNLILFGSHQFNDGNNTTVYTSYTDSTLATPVASTSLVVGGDGVWNEDQVATLTGLSPQTGNVLYIGFHGAPSSLALGYLNSMELVTVVPEPGTLMLLASGGFALVFAFRRTRKT